MLINIPVQGEMLDQNGLLTQQWRLFFQGLYDRTADWESTLINQQFSLDSAAVAEFAKVTPDDSSLVTITSEIGKTLQDLSLQLSASISTGIELQKRFDDLQQQIDAVVPISTDNVLRDLQQQIDAITQVSTDNALRDLEIRLESIPDASAAIAELKKSTITKANKLSDFAPTSSAEFATVITDATGTGKVVFNTSPTLIAPFLGVATGATLTLSNPSNSAGVISLTDTTGNGVNILMNGNGTVTPSKSLRVVNGTFQIINNAYNSVIFTVSDLGSLFLGGGFSCNARQPQLPALVGAAAIDLPTVITLANNLRNTLINNGIAA